MLEFITFEWDENKNSSNKTKHGVSFEEAKSVFFDEHARVISDNCHSGKEDRFIILGMSNLLRTLVVCHCYREDNEVVRIISARKANSEERKQYQNFRGR